MLKHKNYLGYNYQIVNGDLKGVFEEEEIIIIDNKILNYYIIKDDYFLREITNKNQIIFITNSVDMYQTFNFSNVILKPFNIKDLIEAIRMYDESNDKDV